MRSCAFLIAVNSVGAFYFAFLFVHAAWTHFPSSPDSIITTLSILLFCAGALVWNLSSISYRSIALLQNHPSHWQRIELSGSLVFIGAAAIHFTTLELSFQPWVITGYVSLIALTTAEYLVSYFEVDPTFYEAVGAFPYHAGFLIFISSLPVLHLMRNSSTQSTLAHAFSCLLTYNIFGTLHYLLRPLERLGLARGWRPSLYAMHVILTYSAIVYSKAMLSTA